MAPIMVRSRVVGGVFLQYAAGLLVALRTRGCWACGLRHLRLWAWIAAGCVALAAPSAAQVPGQPLAPEGYYIVLTPSGVPYTVPVGAPVAGPAIWPYQEAPRSAPLMAPRATQPAPGDPAAAGTALTLPPPPAVLPRPETSEPPPPLPEVDLSPPPAPVAPPDDVAEPLFPEEEAPAIEPVVANRQYKDGIYAIDEDYWLSYPENAWRILSSPFNFDTQDWLITAGIAGAAGLALLVEEDISDFWQDNFRGDTSDDVFEVVEELGSFRNIGAASLAAYGVAEVFDLKREKAAALMTLESLILSGALTTGIKVVTSRDRPSDTNDVLGFFDRETNRANSSFPSGHSTHAFSTATVISEVYGEDNPWVPWVAYPLAGGVALARLNKDRHWVSDLIVGGAIGHFVAKMVTTYNPFLEEQGIAVAPIMIGDSTGVGFTYGF